MSDFAYSYFNTELEKLDMPALEVCSLTKMHSSTEGDYTVVIRTKFSGNATALKSLRELRYSLTVKVVK